MVDFVSSNLQATNTLFNNIVSKLADVKSDAVSNLETTASTATSTLSSQLSNVTTELRSLVPEPVSIPNINLQAQLQSLSGLTDPIQSTNLLASITSNFSTALSSSGFNLDTLVSSASSAVSSGTSLSGVVPNFEFAADGLSDAIQKASNVKIPSIDPVLEIEAGFSDNTDFTNAVVTAQNAVLTTYETLPTTDVGTLKISDKFKKVTQSTGGVSITKEVTTVTQAVEEISGVITRKNISSKGFSHRVQLTIENFSADEDIILKHEPIKIIRVYGKTSKPESVGKRTRSRFIISPFGTKSSERNNITFKRSYKRDVFTVDGKEIDYDETYRTYDGTPWAIRVTYKYNETYDPSVLTA